MKNLNYPLIYFFSTLLISSKIFSDDASSDPLEGATSGVFMSSEVVFELHGKFKNPEVCLGAKEDFKQNITPNSHGDEFRVAIGAHEGKNPVNFINSREDHLNNIALEVFNDPSESKELIAERDFSVPPTGRSLPTRNMQPIPNPKK